MPPDLFGRLASMKDRAAFEAEKRREMINLQGQIRDLQKEIEQSFATLGAATYRLYREGQIQQPELLQACASLAALQARIEEHERDIVALRNKEYEEVTEPTRICPEGHGELASGNRFCPICGAEAVTVAPTQPQTVFCTQCGSAIPAGSRFCSGCGTRMDAAPSPTATNQQRPSAPAYRPPSTTASNAYPHSRESTADLSGSRAMPACPNCGADTSPGNQWCIYCGAALDEVEVVEKDSRAGSATIRLSETEDEEAPTPKGNVTTLLPEGEVEQQTEEDKKARSGNATTLLPETRLDEEGAEAPSVDGNATTLLPETELDKVAESDEAEAATQICSACDAEIIDGNAFCIHCGHPVAS